MGMQSAGPKGLKRLQSDPGVRLKLDRTLKSSLPILLSPLADVEDDAEAETPTASERHGDH